MPKCGRGSARSSTWSCRPAARSAHPSAPDGCAPATGSRSAGPGASTAACSAAPLRFDSGTRTFGSDKCRRWFWSCSPFSISSRVSWPVMIGSIPLMPCADSHVGDRLHLERMQSRAELRDLLEGKRGVVDQPDRGRLRHQKRILPWIKSSRSPASLSRAVVRPPNLGNRGVYSDVRRQGQESSPDGVRPSHAWSGRLDKRRKRENSRFRPSITGKSARAGACHGIVMPASSPLKYRGVPKAWPLFIPRGRRRRAPPLDIICAHRSACSLRFAAGPCRP